MKKVDLNNASLEELKTLPTVGDAEAKKIIAHRPYKSKGELVTKAGLPEGVYHAVKRKVELPDAAQAGADEVMEPSMKRSISWLGAAAFALAAVVCPVAAVTAMVAAPFRRRHRAIFGQAIAAAAANPANDSSTNSSSAFKVLQDERGAGGGRWASAPIVNFTVFSNGAVKQGLTLSQRPV